MKSKIFIFFVLSLCLTIFADVVQQKWNASSSEWSVNAPNWDSNAVWINGNAALFGQSDFTNIVVPAKTVISTMDFTQGHWSFSGDGCFVSEVYGVSDSVQEGNRHIKLNLADGVSVDFQVAVTNKYGGNYEQRGGTVTFQKPTCLFRTALYGGALNIKNCTFMTAKMEDYANKASTIHFDGATIIPRNNNIILGEYNKSFKDVTVGRGGITFARNIYAPESQLSSFRINHAMRPSDDLNGELDGGVTMTAPYAFYIDSPTCDLKGGFKFLNGTNYLKYVSGIGTGPVYLDAHFYATNSMILPNSITFGPKAVLGLASAARELEFTNGLFSADNEYKCINLVSLDNTEVDIHHVMDDNALPFGGYKLSSGVNLIARGEKWTVAEGESSLFLCPDIISSDSSMPEVLIDNGGLTVDTNGRDIDLGMPLRFLSSVETNCIEEMFFNGSFEDGTTGWTFEKGSNKSGTSDVRPNGSPFDGGKLAYQTKYPTNYAQVRSNGGAISCNFSPSKSGYWRIAFDYANRHDQDPDGQLKWWVLVDNVAIRELANDGLGNHGFITYNSPFMYLEAGKTYNFKFQTGPSIETTYNWDSMLVDGVRLRSEETIVTNIADKLLVKEGEGILRIPNCENSGTIMVKEGELVLGGPYDGCNVNVSSGATFTFSPVVKAALIPNPGFEMVWTDDIQNGLSYSGIIPGWKCSSPDKSRWNVPGWLKDGGVITSSGPHTTNGEHMAFLRPLNAISTFLNVSEEGAYKFSFDCAYRSGSSYTAATNMTLTVKVDGEVVRTISVNTLSSAEFSKQIMSLTLSSGMHELSFETDDGNGLQINGGYMVFLDDVRIEQTSEMIVDESRVWNFASGSTVNVGAMEVNLKEVYVDGVRIKGSTSTFRNAGITVIGTGALRSGPPLGTVLFLK